MSQIQQLRAVLDIGTNSVRLSVVKHGTLGFVPLRREVRITRLGQGVDSLGELHSLSMQRTLEALMELYQFIPSGTPTLILATSAVRDATNKHQFARLVEEKLGLPLRILSGLQEAEFSFGGAVFSLRELHLPGPFTVIDVGGGSTEIYTGLEDGTLLGGGSVQLGAVRMLERFITQHPLLESERLAMEAEIKALLLPLVKKNLDYQPQTLVAVGGTATNLAVLAQNLSVFTEEKVQGFSLSLESLVHLYQKLGSLTLEERKQIPTLQPGREDIIVCGTNILIQAVELLGVNQVITSVGDLIYGSLIFAIDEGE